MARLTANCLDDLAKVQILDSLTQWANKRREQLARMKRDGNVDEGWIQAHLQVLKAVEDGIGQILDLPDCAPS